MSWRTLTEADVLTAIAGPELNAYRIAALKTGQDDPMPEVIATTVQEARGYIAGCKTNRLADGETVPSAMIHHLISIIRYRMMTRLGITVNESREQEYKDARTHLRDTAACRIGIEQPDSGDEDDAVYPRATPTVRSRKRKFTREDQDGI